MQNRKTHAVMILLAVVNGLLVAIRSPAKKDWDIPTYSIGSMKSIATIIFSKFSKSSKKYLTFEIKRQKDHTNMSILLHSGSRVIVQGFTGGEGI